jgi:hypothetical protein
VGHGTIQRGGLFWGTVDGGGDDDAERKFQSRLRRQRHFRVDQPGKLRRKDRKMQKVNLFQKFHENSWKFKD